jgi:hypothetical protein
LTLLSTILKTIFNNGRSSGNIVKNWREILLKISRLLIFAALKYKNSGALVRLRTIPPERPPLVGEVSANFSVVGAMNPNGR